MEAPSRPSEELVDVPTWWMQTWRPDGRLQRENVREGWPCDEHGGADRGASVVRDVVEIA